jgi:hypothetical protein
MPKRKVKTQNMQTSAYLLHVYTKLIITRHTERSKLYSCQYSSWYPTHSSCSINICATGRGGGEKGRKGKEFVKRQSAANYHLIQGS